MFGIDGSKGKKARKSNGDERRPPQAEKHEKEQLSAYEEVPVIADLSDMLDRIKSEMGNSDDLVVRQLRLSDHGQCDVAIVYIQCVVDEMRLDEFVIKTMQEDKVLTGQQALEQQFSSEEKADQMLDRINNHLLSIGKVTEISTFKELFENLFLGSALLFMNGCGKGLAAQVSGGMKRGIEEPKTELALRGPREGLTESIRVNSMLIRRKIRSPRLWLEQMTIGEITQTPVAIMYIQGLVSEDLLKDLRERLDAIQIDGILESNYIEEMIGDQQWSPFPTIMNNERPDVVAGYLLEGKIAILVDGTPFVLLVPVVLNNFFQAAEDYYQSFQMATFLRLLRFLSFIIALLMPSIYVAILGFHQEMIPTQLLLKLAAQREGVPFPAYLEAFIMEFVFEILREAVLRMPSSAGSAISIVGGLVIGQSVVEAGIMSSAVVIVVSFTAIASFVAPVYSLGIAARLLRFFLLLAASTLGFYGIALVVLLLLLHLNSLSSFGVPYLKPFAPVYWKDIKDSLFRAPMWLMKERPQLSTDKNLDRQSTQLEPRQEPSQ